MKLTKSQKHAIEMFRAFLNGNFTPNDVKTYGATVTKFEVSEYGSFKQIWIAAETEFAGLPENNLLRALSHEYWHVCIGKRGRLEVWGCPKSFKQFAGRKTAFGLVFRKEAGL